MRIYKIYVVETPEAVYRIAIEDCLYKEKGFDPSYYFKCGIDAKKIKAEKGVLTCEGPCEHVLGEYFSVD